MCAAKRLAARLHWQSCTQAMKAAAAARSFHLLTACERHTCGEVGHCKRRNDMLIVVGRKLLPSLFAPGGCSACR